jgi:hypothetical protein
MFVIFISSHFTTSVSNDRSTGLPNDTHMIIYYYYFDHEVRPMNGLFRAHDYIRLVVCYMIVQVFVFQQVDSVGVVCLYPADMI